MQRSMKRIIGLCAFALLATLPAFAANGGVWGRILDASGNPIAGVPVAIFQMPLHDSELAVSTLTTDRNGYFSHIALTPGRYLVRANVDGTAVACSIDDVFDGFNTRMVMRVEPNAAATCSGPRVHSASINPAMTADVYIMH